MAGVSLGSAGGVGTGVCLGTGPQIEVRFRVEALQKEAGEDGGQSWEPQRSMQT